MGNLPQRFQPEPRRAGCLEWRGINRSFEHRITDLLGGSTLGVYPSYRHVETGRYVAVQWANFISGLWGWLFHGHAAEIAGVLCFKPAEWLHLVGSGRFANP